VALVLAKERDKDTDGGSTQETNSWKRFAFVNAIAKGRVRSDFDEANLAGRRGRKMTTKMRARFLLSTFQSPPLRNVPRSKQIDALDLNGMYLQSLAVSPSLTSFHPRLKGLTRHGHGSVSPRNIRPPRDGNLAISELKLQQLFLLCRLHAFIGRDRTISVSKGSPYPETHLLGAISHHDVGWLAPGRLLPAAR
jgi:hypothetical protein